jgi:hypothetical protein
MSDEDVGRMSVEGGVAGFAAIVSDLLTTTFGGAAGGDTAPRP